MVLSTGTRRPICGVWGRKAGGSPLTHENAPTGIRTPNGQPWGHDISDFYWIRRVPSVPVQTVWSISMIREFGEREGDVEGRFDLDVDDARRCRVRRPWPLLKLAEEVECSQEIGVEDEGSFYCLNYGSPRVPTSRDRADSTNIESSQDVSKFPSAVRVNESQGLGSERTTGREGAIDLNREKGAGQTGNTNDVETTDNTKGSISTDKEEGATHRTDVRQGSARENEAKISEGNDDASPKTSFVSDEEIPPGSDDEGDAASEADHGTREVTYAAETIPGTNLPPKLEEFLPEEFVPEILVVRDAGNCTSGDQGAKSRETTRSDYQDGQSTHLYRRVLPEPKGKRDSKDSKVADLFLSAKQLHGVGHHSSVYRAELVPPEPLTTNGRSRNGAVTVIAKLGFSAGSARALLCNEAGILNTLSSKRHRHLQQEWCGFNMVRDVQALVPVGPVVPKFYGYYVPDRSNQDLGLSPILLTEDCGIPVDNQTLNVDTRNEIRSLFAHLHFANFLHNSAYSRNILVQPGPLTRPPRERSLMTPSFRIIDFGRTEKFARPAKGTKRARSSSWDFSVRCNTENRRVEDALQDDGDDRAVSRC